MSYPIIFFGRHVPVLLAKWLVSLTSVREVPGTIPTGSRFFCAGTHGIGYSWPGVRVKCIQYTVGSVLGGIRACSDVDVKQNTFTFTFNVVNYPTSDLLVWQPRYSAITKL